MLGFWASGDEKETMLACRGSVKERCPCGARKQEGRFHCRECDPVWPAVFRVPAARELKRAAKGILENDTSLVLDRAAARLPRLPAEIWLRILEYADAPMHLLGELAACEEAPLGTAARMALDDRSCRDERHLLRDGNGRYVYSVSSRSFLWTRSVAKEYGIRTLEIREPTTVPNVYRVVLGKDPDGFWVMVMRNVRWYDPGRCVAEGTLHKDDPSAIRGLKSFRPNAKGVFGITCIVLDCTYKSRDAFAVVHFAPGVRSPPDLTGALWSVKKRREQPTRSGEVRLILRLLRGPGVERLPEQT